MKRVISILLAAIVLAMGLPALPATAAHTHSGTLQSLKTGAGQSVPCCGVFRCGECGRTYEATVTPKDVGMPIVMLEGDLSGMTKERKVTARLTFTSEDRSFVTVTTMKWQGDSSLRYPKKNYSLGFIIIKETGLFGETADLVLGQAAFAKRGTDFHLRQRPHAGSPQ